LGNLAAITGNPGGLGSFARAAFDTIRMACTTAVKDSLPDFGSGAIADKDIHCCAEFADIAVGRGFHKYHEGTRGDVSCLPRLISSVTLDHRTLLLTRGPTSFCHPACLPTFQITSNN
jgi:hypothetical protein